MCRLSIQFRVPNFRVQTDLLEDDFISWSHLGLLNLLPYLTLTGMSQPTELWAYGGT